MFVGTILGDIIGTLYLLAYQIIGVLIALRIIKNEKLAIKILIGSVIGSIGLHWCPIIFSFALQFTQASHICGLILFALIGGFILYSKKFGTPFSLYAGRSKDYVKDSIKNYPVLIIGVPLFIFFCMMLWNHTIITNDSGGLSTGQCGYGDMNMHLGFITSIANQHMFPPYYSILPDAKLSYPFLSDTISSSIYIWGASLRYAFMLPMWIAILQVFAGLYFFAEAWLKSCWKAFLAFVLFLFNGGFGFIYFFNGYKTFDDLMHGFYNTPTNLVEVGVRWTNTIVDMLLPQRATLFGWAVLFPVLVLLYKAWVNSDKKYYTIVAILGGALPMIHTHSFLALGLISFGWLVVDCAKRAGTNWLEDEATDKKSKIILSVLCIGGIAVLSAFSYMDRKSEAGLNPKLLMFIGILGAAVIFVIGLIFFMKSEKEDRKYIICSWGKLLLIVLLIAFPQLLYWTFGQVSEGEMLRGHFNWSNTGDTAMSYPLYYLLNIGLVAVLFIPAWITGKKKNIATVFPAMIIWFLCEFVVFQPNVYDNNKLLLAAYMLICCFVAGAVCDWISALFAKPGIVSTIGKVVVTAVLTVVVTLSGVLTMAREYYSGTPASWYELYNAGLVEACQFIEDYIPEDATILTATNHNNAVASLTGRNIVCGSSTFLYFHGFETFDREEDVVRMYSDPLNSDTLFRQYGVDFILVSDNEYGMLSDRGLQLDENLIYGNFNCVFSNDSARIYQIVR